MKRIDEMLSLLHRCPTCGHAPVRPEFDCLRSLTDEQLDGADVVSPITLEQRDAFERLLAESCQAVVYR